MLGESRSLSTRTMGPLLAWSISPSLGLARSMSVGMRSSRRVVPCSYTGLVPVRFTAFRALFPVARRIGVSLSSRGQVTGCSIGR